MSTFRKKILLISSFDNLPERMNVLLREQQLHFYVEEILDGVYSERVDSYFFRIKWDSRYDHNPTWEPLANLRCPKKLSQWVERSGNSQTLRPVRLTYGENKIDRLAGKFEI